MNIAVLVPCNYSHFMKEFAMSLITVQSYFYEWQKRTGRNDNLSIITKGGLHLDKMRNDLVQAALDSGHDILIFFDADMSFPPNIIEMMVGDFEDNPDVEAITGIYTWKDHPHLPHVYKTYDPESKKYMIAGQFPLEELFQVEGAGTGCLAVKAGVYKRTEKPWFKFGKWGDSLPMGEDLYFCYKAKPLMLCDPRIRCQHYQTVGVGLDDYIDRNGLKRTTTRGFEVSQDRLEEIAQDHLSKPNKKPFDDFVED